MILTQVQDNRKAIGALHLKVDEKDERVHERLNTEVATCHKRINPIEAEQAGQRQKIREHRRAIRWLVWGLSTIALTLLGALAGIVLAYRGGL